MYSGCVRRWPCRSSHSPDVQGGAQSRQAALDDRPARRTPTRTGRAARAGRAAPRGARRRPRRSRPRSRSGSGPRSPVTSPPSSRATRSIPGSRALSVAKSSGTYSCSQKRSIASPSKREDHDRPARDASQLAQAALQIGPLVDRDRRHAGVEAVVVERQRLGDADDRGRRSLRAHRGGRLDRDDVAISGLVGPRARAHVQDARSIPQRRPHVRSDPRVGPALPRVAAAAELVVEITRRQGRVPCRRRVPATRTARHLAAARPPAAATPGPCPGSS